MTKDLESIRSILVETAKRSHEWSKTAENTLATASKLSREIGAAIGQHPGSRLSLNAAAVALRKDSIKCQALLSSQMSPDSLVQQLLLSQGNPERNVEVDGSTKVGTSQRYANSDISTSKRSRYSSEAIVPGNKASPVNSETGNPSGPSHLSNSLRPNSALDHPLLADAANRSQKDQGNRRRDPQQSAKSNSQAGVEVNTRSLSTVPSREFQHQLYPQLQEYLKSHGLSEEGNREELISRCQAKHKELSTQTMKAQEGNINPPTQREPSQSTAEVATPAGDSSKSSDGPPSPESSFKRALKSMNPFRSSC